MIQINVTHSYGIIVRVRLIVWTAIDKKCFQRSRSWKNTNLNYYYKCEFWHQPQENQSPLIIPIGPRPIPRRFTPGPNLSSRPPPDVMRTCLSTSWNGMVNQQRSRRAFPLKLTSLRALAELVSADKKAVSWTSSYSYCGRCISADEEVGIINDACLVEFVSKPGVVTGWKGGNKSRYRT